MDRDEEKCAVEVVGLVCSPVSVGGWIGAGLIYWPQLYQVTSSRHAYLYSRHFLREARSDALARLCQ